MERAAPFVAESYTTISSCRACGSLRLMELFSLGPQYISNFVEKDTAWGIQVPIDICICRDCTLVQQRHTAPQELLYRRFYWYRCIGASEKLFARIKGKGRLHRDCLVHDTAEHILSSPYDIELPCVQKDGSVEWRPILHRSMSVRPVYCIEFFTGARVIASAEHRWPRLHSSMKWISDRTTSQLKPKDKVPLVHDFTRPDELVDHDSIYDEEMGYFIGAYLAEGCPGGINKVALILTVNPETDKTMIQRIEKFVQGRIYEGISYRNKRDTKAITIYISGHMITALVRKFVRGSTSKGKCLQPDAWVQPISFLRGIVDGWLDGDGHYEPDQERWRFNICKNTDLVEDMSLACRLVGYRMRYRLRAGGNLRNGTTFNQYCGWVRKSDSRMRQHLRIKNLGCTSVRRIWKQNKPKRTWDIAIGGDELYALGCGIVTHNSSVTKTMQDALRDIAWTAERRFDARSQDTVLDIGSNDGTLLRSYRIPGLVRVGVEPALNLAGEGAKDVNVFISDFWDYDKYWDRVKKAAKIITAIGMFYDLADPNKFIGDIARALRKDGVFIAQLMCLKNMLDSFDVGNLCHEHIELYSLRALQYLYEKHGLEIFDIETNDVNGKSYRIYARHVNYNEPVSARVLEALQLEQGLDQPKTYDEWFKKVEKNKQIVVEFIQGQVANGKKVWVLGASTKGNTLLQYYGLDSTMIAGASERSPEKWGRVTAGTGIPIYSEQYARAADPDFFLVLPYTFLAEIMEREANWHQGGRKFIVPLPQFRLV
jgi:SAM-dependent methyltransferase